MKLIAGLGNPDDKYKFTRHNAGFMLLDYLSYKYNFDFKNESKFFGQIAKTIFANEQVLFLKPMTYMNLSGKSLIEVMNFYKIPREDLIVVYDDISLDVGRIRFRANGSDGGHNGIKSIINVLGGNKNFESLKIGFGPQPPMMPSEAYVLQNFNEQQLVELKTVLGTCAEALEYYLNNDIQAVQNKYN